MAVPFGLPQELILKRVPSQIDGLPPVLSSPGTQHMRFDHQSLDSSKLRAQGDGSLIFPCEGWVNMIHMVRWGQGHGTHDKIGERHPLFHPMPAVCSKGNLSLLAYELFFRDAARKTAISWGGGPLFFRHTHILLKDSYDTYMFACRSCARSCGLLPLPAHAGGRNDGWPRVSPQLEMGVWCF